MRFIWSSLIWMCCCFTACVYASEAVCVSAHCIVVVDAGSTGSRAHLFAYNLDDQHLPTDIQTVWSKRITPGLATVASNQTAMDNYLNALFSGMPDSNVPVYFYATAGMRLLPDNQQDRLYHLLHTWFRQHARPLLAAKTISGQEEGVLAWLAVAWQSGRIADNAWSDLGVIDTGGASVQMVFPLQVTDHKPNPHVVSFTLNGQPVSLFAYSGLGVGKTIITAQFLTDESCFPNHYLAVESRDNGDVYRCSEHMTQWLNTQDLLDATVTSHLVQASAIHWNVLGGLAYLVNSPALQFSPTEVTLEALSAQAQTRICSVEWAQLFTTYVNEALAFDCLNAAYYHALLTAGYGLSEHTALDVTLGQTGLGWALGVVLLHPH